VQHAVNMAALDRSELDDMRMYFDLARRLGLLHAQMARGTIRKVSLNCRGEIALRNTQLVTAAFVAGLMQFWVESVNIVNAETLARDRGIEIVESSSPRGGDFGSVLHSEVVTENKTYTAAGTLLGNQYHRLVQLGSHRLDAFLDGILLILSHRDRPGLIGYIGGVFGRHEVNISQMAVGRSEAGGEAIAVLNLDSTPPDEAVAEIEQNENITSVRIVKLPVKGTFYF
jgi:D-3-phosphoglycerate dehydrogenase